MSSFAQIRLRCRLKVNRKLCQRIRSDSKKSQEPDCSTLGDDLDGGILPYHADPAQATLTMRLACWTSAARRLSATTITLQPAGTGGPQFRVGFETGEHVRTDAAEIGKGRPTRLPCGIATPLRDRHRRPRRGPRRDQHADRGSERFAGRPLWASCNLTWKQLLVGAGVKRSGWWPRLLPNRDAA